MFARIFLLWIASLMLVQAGFRYLDVDSPLSFGETAFDPSSPSAAAQQQEAELQLELAAQGASVQGIAPLVSIRPAAVDLGAHVAPHLRDAIWAPHAGASSNDAYLREACSSGVTCLKTVTRWVDVRLAAHMVVLCVVLLALRAWWLRTVRHDLLAMIATLRSAASGTEPPPARVDTPRNLHGLARAIGDLLCRRSGTVEDQSAMFAAFLRQIESRVARLRAYAMNVTRWNLRVALVEDIDLFQDLARQFVDTAGQGGANHAPVNVDAYLKDRFVYGANADASIVLRLDAGEAFALPRAALGRLVDNLVGNAQAHGKPPIEICTARGPRTWTLSVRDHGEGTGASLPEGGTLASPALASRAASLGLDSHWGMGLSIVRRLARLCNAKLKIGNHPEGGLWVRMIVPMEKTRQA
ncbi:sensor histidine kinase [Paraburkholderia acidiphila]|uniref:histidine kinase n=1 Tax=Paraburkholderia acidiphila TaxID=2571747 RepID=A0A7Z2JCV3_9BURK|nr:ATP-binding protein [Paraburkholderia acidiphila]QGZ60021.1 histidine kinase [Paraburkholderia acidiphila]